MTLRRVESIRNRGCSALCPELIGPSRALLQLPLIFEQVFEKAVAPLRRRRAPGDFRTAGDRVFAFARAEAALPAEALILDQRGFRIRLEVRPIRIHVDEAHIHGSQRILEIADARVALVAFWIRKPDFLLA